MMSRQQEVLTLLAERTVRAAVREIVAAPGLEDFPWNVRADWAFLKTIGLVGDEG